MNIDYKKIFNKNYMILSDCNSIDYRECYRSKMLKNNHLDYFLVYDTQNINGEIQFTYDISSKQSLYSFYENSTMDYEMIRHFILSLKSAFDILQNYLLEPDYLILNPQFIYLNLATKNLFFCYCPGEKNSFYDSLKNFLDYLITKINQEDRDAIVLAYSLQQQAVNPNFTLDELLQILNKSCTKQDSIFPANTPQSNNTNKTKNSNIETEHTEKLFENHTFNNKISETETNTSAPTVFEYSFCKPKAKDISKSGTLSLFPFILWGIGILILVYLFFLPNHLSLTIKYIAGILTLSICTFSSFYLSGKKNNSSLKNTPFFEQIEQAKVQEDFPQAKTPSFLFPDEQKNNTPEFPDIKHSYYEDTVILGYRETNKNPRLVYTGTDFSSEAEITQFPFLIGKMKENVNMVIDHVMISRIHAKIYKKENLYYIEDMNSSNGTYVNNEAIPSHTLIEIKTGDYITFSHLTYIFQ